MIDRFRSRNAAARSDFDGWDGWGGQGYASGAAMLTTTYGTPGAEQILPSLVGAASSAYATNAVVFGAILARIMLFSEAQFKYQALQDQNLYGTPALGLLENPWPNGTTGEMLARMIQDVDLAGNAYVWRAAPDRLVRLRPDWITIISEFVPRDSSGRTYREVLGYYYKPPAGAGDEETGGEMLFDVSEIAHWSPIPDPWASFRGMSWLTPVLREIEGDQAMTEYKIKYLANAASPNLLVKYAQRLGKGTAERIQERIQARHGGVSNAFRTLVLDEGADVSVIGNSFEQMGFATVQAAGENRIVIASGVPGIVIGSKEGLMAATYSNYEQAMRRFADITMRPLWRSVCACLAKLVPVPSGSRLWYDVRGIAALRQGEKEAAETMQLKGKAASELAIAGFSPESIASALETGDFSLLKAAPPPPVVQPGNSSFSIPSPSAVKINGSAPPAQIGAGK